LRLLLIESFVLSGALFVLGKSTFKEKKPLFLPI